MQGLEVKKALNLLLPFHPLTNIEISEYYKIEPRFNGVYSRNNLLNKIKKGAYVINLDKYENTGTHWASLFVKANKVIYFDSFGIEHIPKEINNFIGNKKIKASIFKIQAYDSIMCGYFCIEFINYILKGKKLLTVSSYHITYAFQSESTLYNPVRVQLQSLKKLLDYTNLFSPNDFKKNDQVIKIIFKNE